MNLFSFFRKPARLQRKAKRRLRKAAKRDMQAAKLNAFASSLRTVKKPAAAAVKEQQAAALTARAQALRQQAKGYTDHALRLTGATSGPKVTPAIITRRAADKRTASALEALTSGKEPAAGQAVRAHPAEAAKEKLAGVLKATSPENQEAFAEALREAGFREPEGMAARVKADFDQKIAAGMDPRAARIAIIKGLRQQG